MENDHCTTASNMLKDHNYQSIKHNQKKKLTTWKINYQSTRLLQKNLTTLKINQQSTIHFQKKINNLENKPAKYDTLPEITYQSTKHNQKELNNLENMSLKLGSINKIIFLRQWPTTAKEKDQKKTLLLLFLSNNHKAFPYESKLPILAVKDLYNIYRYSFDFVKRKTHWERK